jgi:hypothetical protein
MRPYMNFGRALWKITEKLKDCGLKQSKFDPCLFVGSKVICIVYVDDIIFWSKDMADINSLTMRLQELSINLESEDDPAGLHF